MKNKSSKITYDMERVDQFLKPLENLQPADAPSFLFTRIKQVIATSQYDRISRGKALLAGSAFCILLLVNTFILLRTQTPAKKNESLVQSLNLLPDNDLYK